MKNPAEGSKANVLDDTQALDVSDGAAGNSTHNVRYRIANNDDDDVEHDDDDDDHMADQYINSTELRPMTDEITCDADVTIHREVKPSLWT